MSSAAGKPPPPSRRPPARAHQARIRAAAAEDAAAIAAIEHASFEHSQEKFDQRKVRALIRNRRAAVLAAEAVDTGGKSRIIGWAAGIVGPHRPHRWGRVYAIAVDPNARGLKLGGELLQRIIDLLRTRGARRIFLEVRTDNAAAIRLYHRFGFAACRHLADYYAPGVDAQRMKMEIGDGEDHRPRRT